jgi:hypothetical protein
MDDAQRARATEAHWFTEGVRDATEGRPLKAGRAAAYPSYAEGYKFAEKHQ